MKEKIKKCYDRIEISGDAKQRIYQNIISPDEKGREKKIPDKAHNWKMAVAACLALTFVVSTGAYATGKIMQYFESSVSENGNRVDMKFHMTQEAGTTESHQGEKDIQEQKYIKITTSFGTEYQQEKMWDEGEDKTYSYSHKEGFSSGKNFWFELVYLDQDKETILSTFDNEKVKQLEINGQKGVYCRFNNVVGSKYNSDHDTDYNQALYIFLDDYGYLLRMVGQQKLSQKEFVKLAEQIQVEEVSSKQEATDYVLFSMMDQCAFETQYEEKGVIDVKNEINTTNYSTNGENKVRGGVVKVKEVQVLDSLTSLDEKCFNSSDYVDREKLFDKNGKLKTYERETVRYGNGIDAPEQQVTGTKVIQPKLIYVTLEFDKVKAFSDGTLQVPSLQLVTKQGHKIYRNNRGYNRPKYIENAYMDNMPCYFEENLGGNQFWMSKANNQKFVMHFAYLIDEDLVNGMALCLNDWVSSEDEQIYMDISQ